TALLAAATLAMTACGDGGGSSEAEVPQKSGPATIRLWINGPDTPESMRKWLKTEFEKQNPGSKLVIEEQQWEGLVERLTTSLGSPKETPDVVEVGNTQAATFTNVGAFADITDLVPKLGGDDLLESFVEAGSVDDKTTRYRSTRARPTCSTARTCSPSLTSRSRRRWRSSSRRPRSSSRTSPACPASPACGSPARTGVTGWPSCGTRAVTWRCRKATSGSARCPSRRRRRDCSWSASCSRRLPAPRGTGTRPTRRRRSVPTRWPWPCGPAGSRARSRTRRPAARTW